MKNEIKIFLTALMFYTRVPVKNINGWSEAMLNQSTRYFPIIGILVGAVGVAIFWCAQLIFPVSVAAILSMITTILFTGAFHEDGFADFCDGFGGGFTAEKTLEIMKDSRIGTYGSIGLIMMLGTKFLALTHLETARMPLLLLVGHAISRVVPVLLIYTLAYARLDATSKTKPIGKAGSKFSLVFAVLTGCFPLFLIRWQEALIVGVVLIILFIFFRKFTRKKLGGYTGDVLGALQQLSEVFFYLSILGYQHFA